MSFTINNIFFLFLQAEKIQEKEGTPVIRTGTEPRRNSDNLALLISHLMTKHAQ